MIDKVSSIERGQIIRACEIVKQHLSQSLVAIHLYGSVIDGGLKPFSDIDLLVTVRSPLQDLERRKLMCDLLDCSSDPESEDSLRALEITVVSLDEVVPWRYPAKREMQFGEWLRKDILQGNIESQVEDIDLTILLKKVRKHSIPLWGQAANVLFEPIPDVDFFKALGNTLNLWNKEQDWKGDERNVILTLARIWYSASTGHIVSKETAARWLLVQLPSEYQFLLKEAIRQYLTGRVGVTDTPHSREVAHFVDFAKASIKKLFDK